MDVKTKSKDEKIENGDKGHSHTKLVKRVISNDERERGNDLINEYLQNDGFE